MACFREGRGLRPLTDAASISLRTDNGTTGWSRTAPRPARQNKKVIHGGEGSLPPRSVYQDVLCSSRTANNDRPAPPREGSTARAHHHSHHTQVPRRWVTRSSNAGSRWHQCDPCRYTARQVKGARSGEGNAEGIGKGGGVATGTVAAGRRMRWSSHSVLHNVARGRCERARKGTLHAAQLQREVKQWGCSVRCSSGGPIAPRKGWCDHICHVLGRQRRGHGQTHAHNGGRGEGRPGS